MGESVEFRIMDYDWLIRGASYRFMVTTDDEFNVFWDVKEELVERLSGQFCLMYGREDGLADNELELVVHYHLECDTNPLLIYLIEKSAWDIRQKKAIYGPPGPPPEMPEWLKKYGEKLLAGPSGESPPDPHAESS